MSQFDFSYSATSYQLYSGLSSQEAFKQYLLDSGRIQYGAYLFDKSITRNTDRVVSSINDVSEQIKSAAEAICGGLNQINDQLSFLNRKMDIAIEQQRITNLLLKDISEMLRIPDSEKERQYSISMGLKFFANAANAPSLYDDSLEEFLKAEAMQKQDYFVLHRIGLIYLYCENHIDPEKAFDYFSRAAKYAMVESDPNAVRLADLLSVQTNKQYYDSLTNPVKIKSLAADSLEKAAFSSYILGDMKKAIQFQQYAYDYYSSAENLFLLSKYQAHDGQLDDAVENLNKAIDASPFLAEAVFHEVDLMERPEVLNLVNQKNSQVENNLLTVLEKNLSDSVNDYINKSLESSYAVKIKILKRLTRRGIA